MMNQMKQSPDKLGASSTKMLRAMVSIGMLCALLIVLTYEGTLARIEHLKAEALGKAIFRVIPGITTTRAFQRDLSGNFIEVTTIEKSAQVVYAGYDKNGKLLGVAIEASGQGYADILRILYGYNPETQKIVGFYVLESKETPGLGDKIEKDPDFLSNFSALDVSLADDLSAIKNLPVTVKQGTKKNAWEIDGITGATISSRAIGDIIGNSVNDMVPVVYKNKEVFKISETEKKE